MTEYMKSGISGLDKILQGGLPRDQMYGIYGTSGSGKTTLSLQFLLKGVADKERCLYLCTSETELEIKRIATSHGWSLKGLKIEHISTHFGDKPGPGQTMLYPVEIELPQIVEKLINLIREYSPQRVVIDSLSEIRLLARENSWYQRQLMTLKRFLEPRSCTALLTDTVGEENTILKTIVHGVIEMSRSEPLYGPDRRRIRVEKLRGHPFISGFHDYKIVKGGVRVFPRLISSDYRRKFPPELVSSGIAELDFNLGGGIDRSTCVLLQGAAGTGKSALASQFASAAALRDERTLVFCFDERISTFVKRTRSLGIDIDVYMNDGRIVFNQVDPAELSAGEFTDIIVRSVLNEDISQIIIDSLNGYAYALPDEHFLSVHIHELASFLSVQGVVTFLTMAHHVGFGLSAAEHTFNVSYVADTVINLGYFEHRGEVHKALSVVKKRTGNHQRSIRELYMDSQGVHIGPVLEEFEGIGTGSPKYTGSDLPPKENN
ncbi:ATPase domain-containing protein [Chitinispirillales bacterium ANBcel5]|uniref:ATPase domain-containing protein n=1 Tax=Cellulosispirillum alkaliphilum TaxID=3039283 RepID=UPI002A54E079|nr:ATPase domain-containing protein [Chitinispirillales bacterium ANBcel5]